MEVLEAIRERRSVRKFKPGNVSLKTVAVLVEAARWAPSAGNIQPWEFIVVRQAEAKRRLVDAVLKQSFLSQASAVIVVCADENQALRYGSRGKTLYCLQDTAAAVQNILLAACSMGLGACWIGAFDEEGVKRVLKIPDGVRPVAVVPVGCPAEAPEPPERRPLKEIMHREAF